MQIPHIQIRQMPARLSIDADIGKQTLEQPRAVIDMSQPRAKQQIRTTRGELDINQDRVWDALGLGNNLDTMLKIYSLSKDLALQGIGNIVEKGNRMAAIHKGGNAIAELAYDWRRSFPQFDFRGPASYDNVDFQYRPGKVEIETTPSRVELNVQVKLPIHQYERGRLDIQMGQYPKVEIIPPQLDEYM